MKYFSLPHARVSLVAGAFLLTLIGSALAAGQDVKGTWVGWVDANDFLGAMRVEVKDGGAGTVTIFYAGDKRSGELDALKVAGADVSFEGKLQPNGRFIGKRAGDRIAGTFEALRKNGTVADKGNFEIRHVDGSYQPKTPTASAGTARVGLSKPSGKLPVGRRLFFWTDDARAETITPDPSDRRRVFVQLWYPAGSSKGTLAEYLPTGVFPDPPADQKNVRTHAVVDARMAKGKFPLIVFSPGLGTSSLRYVAIIEDLVSHGYVVAAINHPYDSGPVTWSDGTKIDQDKKWDLEISKTWTAEDRKKFFDERRLGWAADASFVVDQLKKLDVATSIDFDRIGMLGHSYGGQAASIVCARDARFRACANLDGLAQGNAVLPDASGKSMTQPFLFFTKAAEVTDEELEMAGLTRNEYRARERKRLAERWRPGFKGQIASLTSGGFLIVYPGITHMTFSDGPLLDQKSTKPYEDRVRTAATINSYIRAFFDQELMGKSSPLLRPGRPGEVMVQVLKK
jgi:pimeloyl-ACP methyl ester carboxylesterase